MQEFEGLSFVFMMYHLHVVCIVTDFSVMCTLDSIKLNITETVIVTLTETMHYHSLFVIALANIDQF